MTNEARRFELDGPATLEQARAFAIAAGRRLRSWGLPEERVAVWELAVAEMATNVSKHGYPPGAPGPMQLVLLWDGRGLTISIGDEGAVFDPTQVRPLEPDPDDPDTWPEGGMGLHLVRAAGDELTYRTEGLRHVLSLYSSVPAPPGRGQR